MIDLVSSVPLELITLVIELSEGSAAPPTRGAAALSVPANVRMLRAAVGAMRDDVEDESSTGTQRFLRILRFARLLRLLRLLKIQKYINMLEEMLNVNLQIISLAKFLSMIIYLMHVLACIWFSLAYTAPYGDSQSPVSRAHYIPPAAVTHPHPTRAYASRDDNMAPHLR